MTARPMMIVMTMIVLTVTEYGVVGAGSTIICYLISDFGFRYLVHDGLALLLPL